MDAFGWFGPLVDLSATSAHIGAYVQLLAFVHQFRGIQKLKTTDGREVSKATVIIGDDTLPFFEIVLWQKQVYWKISAGDIIILHNMKITKFRNLSTASAIQQSSCSTLLKSHEVLSHDGVDGINVKAQMSSVLKEKLNRVMRWAQLTHYTLLSFLQKLREQKEIGHNANGNEKSQRNWSASSIKKLTHCSSIADFSSSKEACLVSFFGNIGELCLPANMQNSDFSSCLNDWIFVGKNLLKQSERKIAEVFLAKGCKNCGFPMYEKNSSYGTPHQSSLPPSCSSNVSEHHQIGWIYRPFLLHIWDHSAHVPVLVKNPAAQQIFGNISADNLSKDFETFQLSSGRNNVKDSSSTQDCSSTSSQGMTGARCCIPNNVKLNALGKAIGEQEYQQDIMASSRKREPIFELYPREARTRIVFLKIFYVIIRSLLNKDRNSPFKFKVLVHPLEPKQTTRNCCLFELVSFGLDMNS